MPRLMLCSCDALATIVSLLDRCRRRKDWSGGGLRSTKHSPQHLRKNPKTGIGHIIPLTKSSPNAEGLQPIHHNRIPPLVKNLIFFANRYSSKNIRTVYTASLMKKQKSCINEHIIRSPIMLAQETFSPNPTLHSAATQQLSSTNTFSSNTLIYMLLKAGQDYLGAKYYKYYSTLSKTRAVIIQRGSLKLEVSCC